MSVDMSVTASRYDTPGGRLFVSNHRDVRDGQIASFSELKAVIHIETEDLYDTKSVNRYFLSCTIEITNLPTQLNIQFQVVFMWMVSMAFSSLQLLTIPQAASILAVSPSTIRRLLAQGDIEYTRIQRAVRIRREALEAYVDCNTTYVSIRFGSNS